MVVVPTREAVELLDNLPDATVVRKSGVLLNGGAEFALSKGSQLGPEPV